MECAERCDYGHALCSVPGECSLVGLMHADRTFSKCSFTEAGSSSWTFYDVSALRLCEFKDAS